MISKKILPFKVLPLALAVTLAGCGDDDIDPDGINAPSHYEFISSFDGNSSVEYKQASTYFILVKELEHLIKSDYLQTLSSTYNYTQLKALINRVFEGGTVSSYQDNLVATDLYSTNTSATQITGFTLTNSSDYSELSADINIQDWLPSTILPRLDESDPTWSARTLTNTFTGIAALANDGNDDTKYIDENQNRDHLAIILSLLRVGIPYFYITNYLLSDTQLSDNNATTLLGKNHTQLEHNWDMAFGFSGSTADLKSLTEEMITGRHHSEWANLNELLTNKTDGLLYYAALIDQNSQHSSTDLAKRTQQQLLNGRTLIKEMQNSDVEIAAQQETLKQVRNELLFNLEQIVTALTMAQMNDTIQLSYYIGPDYEGTPLQHAYFSAWSKLYVYSQVLELNPFNHLNEQLLEDLTSTVSGSPNMNSGMIKDFRNDLTEIRDRLAVEVKIDKGAAASWRAIDL